MESSCFKGKLAIVTGAGQGIGRSVALELAARGCEVLAIGRTEAKLLDLQRSASDASLIRPLVLDVSDWTHTKDALEAAIAARPANYVVNNAHAMIIEPFGQIQERSIDAQVAVIIKATINISQVATERMKACGVSGSIVNLSTNGSKHVPPFPASVYCSVKAAVDHLTHCMAVELAPYKIRVNTVSPGMVNGPSFTVLPPEARSNMEKYWSEACPLKKLVEPNEVAAAILFLLNDANSSLTGANIPVEGGAGCK